MSNQPTHVMTGVSVHRIYRGPYDAESVVNSYQDLVDYITPTDNGSTVAGHVYSGAIVSVANDDNTKLNAPYYISYTQSGTPGNYKISYHAERILTESEIIGDNSYMRNEYVRLSYQLAERPEYTKPQMSVQFNSAISNSLTTIKSVSTIYEDVEIGTYFRPGIQINWPTRLESTYGTRAVSNEQRPNRIDNMLLGYSYGVSNNGISFLLNGQNTSAYVLGKIVDGPVTYCNNEKEYIIYDNVKISYLQSSYMFYPQWYRDGRFEISKGEQETAWFGEGTYIPATTKYVVNAKYKYYYGFTDKLPMSKDDLLEGQSGLLNNTSFKEGTTTSIIVGDGEDKRYFYVAYPSMYAIAAYNRNGLRIPLQQPNGVIWDMISHRQNMYVKKMPVLLSNSNIEEQYNVAFFDFEDAPIGNPSAIMSFKILPEDAIEATIIISCDDGTLLERDEDEMIIRTETSNNIIFNDKVFS